MRTPTRRPVAGRSLAVRATIGLAAVALLAGVVLLLGAWQAQRHLTSAQARLPELKEALSDLDPAATRSSLGGLQSDAAAARRATSGPVWAAVAALPWVGDTPRAVRTITTTVDDLAQDVLPELADAADVLTPARLLPEPGRVDVAALEAATPSLERAHASLTALSDATAREDRLVVGPVARARDDLARDLARVESAVGTGLDATRLLPAALGGDGPRRYFVAFQTGAESRGTGGLVGAYAILTADDGRLSVPVIGDDRALIKVTSQLDLGAEYRALYGRDPELWGNSNLSPHFPYAAQRWLDVWRKHTGQQLDGALATDPVALGHLLRTRGPVELPDGEQLTADRVVRLTQWDAYARFEDDDARKRYLVGIARAVVGELLDGSGDVRSMVPALRRVVEDRRLAVWSRHPDEQRALSGGPVSGEVPDDEAPYAAVVVNNAAGNKLDYHLRREVAYELTPCRSGQRDSVVRVRLTNDVPDGPLAEYASGRRDLARGAPFPLGSNKLNVAVYVTAGAALRGAEVDGVPHAVRAGRERGHPVFVVPLELQRGETRSLVLNLVEPARGGQVRVPEQPLVLPQETTVRDAGCPVREQAVSRAAAPAS